MVSPHQHLSTPQPFVRGLITPILVLLFAKTSAPPQSIGTVESNSPAAAGGLKIYDVARTVNDKDMSRASLEDISKAIKKARHSSDHLELLFIENVFMIR